MVTVIIAAKTLIDITMIADTRVSYGEDRFDPDKGVLKLLPITFGETSFAITLGFAGYLSPINDLFSYLIYEKLWKYNRRLVMEYLGEEVKGWIQEFVPKLSAQTQEDLRKSDILLCGFEMFDRPRKYVGAKPSFALPPLGYLFSYKVGEYGKVDKKAHEISVIGKGKKERPLIEHLAAHYFLSHPRTMSPPDFLESYAMCSDALRLFQEKQLISVGGPFQCVQLIPHFPVRQFFVGEDAPYEVNRVDSETIEIVYQNTGRKHPLYSLRKWIEKNGVAQGDVG